MYSRRQGSATVLSIVIMCFVVASNAPGLFQWMQHLAFRVRITLLLLLLIILYTILFYICQVSNRISFPIYSLNASISTISFTASTLNMTCFPLSSPTATQSSIRIPIPLKCFGHLSSSGIYNPGSIVIQLPFLRGSPLDRAEQSCTSNPT